MLTHPNTKNLKYKKKEFYLDKKKLKRAMLSEASIWNQDSDSEPQFDNKMRSPTISDRKSDDQTHSSKRTTTAKKRKAISLVKITPNKFSVTFREKIARYRKIKESSSTQNKNEQSK